MVKLYNKSGMDLCKINIINIFAVNSNKIFIKDSYFCAIITISRENGKIKGLRG